MRIGIILHPYGEEEQAGLGRAIFELAKAMIAAAPQYEFLVFVKGNPDRKPEFPGENWRLHPLGNGLRWLNWLHNAPPADIYIFNTPVLPRLWRRKSVVIALDFAYLYFPSEGVFGRIKRFLLKRRHSAALKLADKIVAISEATRGDAIRHFGVSPDKIVTLHLGYTQICRGPEEKLEVPERFFLFVGVLKARKNVHNLVNAFIGFRHRHPDFHLLLVGKAEGHYAKLLQKEVRREKLEDAVHFLGYRSDGQLAYLYRRAAALVYPSIIEGFGFPVLEAMDCGTPVITSRTSSLPEVAGSAALLVDPYDPTELAQAMERIASDRPLIQALAKRGSEQSKRFSWERSARDILKVLQ